MSRSRRRTPIWANTTARSEKYFKRHAQQGLRKRVKQILRENPECEILPLLRETSNVWSFPKDGKCGYCHDPKPEWMRK